MSLKPSPAPDVPELTARVARAAFPKGNPYLRLRDELVLLAFAVALPELAPLAVEDHSSHAVPALAPIELIRRVGREVNV